MSQQQQSPPSEAEALEAAVDRALAKLQKPGGEIQLTPRGIDFGNFEGLWRWAGMILRSKMAPKGFETQEAITLAALKGRSVGIVDPFESLWSMAVINGRPSIWGDLPLAICRQHRDWEESGFDEYYLVDGSRWDERKSGSVPIKDSTTAVVETLRKGASKPMVRTFSIADAKVAGLLAKDSPWKTYPARMLKWRARGFCLRDNFGDALKGLGIVEVDDAENPVIDVTPREPAELPLGRSKLNGNGRHEAATPSTPPTASATPAPTIAAETPPSDGKITAATSAALQAEMKRLELTGAEWQEHLSGFQVYYSHELTEAQGLILLNKLRATTTQAAAPTGGGRIF